MPGQSARSRVAAVAALLALLVTSPPASAGATADRPPGAPRSLVTTAPAGTAPAVTDAGAAVEREAPSRTAPVSPTAARTAARGVVGDGDGVVERPAVPVVDAVAPRRLLDTRTPGTPRAGRPLSPGETVTLPVLGLGVPSAGPSAVLLNVTVVAGSRAGWVRVDDGTSSPTSTVNFRAGEVVANQVLVAVPSGTVRVVDGTGGGEHVVVDVQGWVGPGADLQAVTPRRVVDTRATRQPLVAGRTSVLALAPPPGTRAVVANLTAVPRTTTPAYVTSWQAGTARPATSSVNVAGSPSSALTVLPVDATGRVAMTVSAGTVDVVVDVEGYLSAPAAQARVYDTRRAGTGGTSAPLTAGTVRTVPVARVGGVPVGTRAVLAHLTVTDATTQGVLVGWASGAARPGTSSLNFAAGRTTSNTVLLPLGADGALRLWTTARSVHVVVDVQHAVAAPSLVPTVPPDLSWLSAAPPPDAAAARDVLLAADRYLSGTWWSAHAPGLLASPLDRATLSTSAGARTDAVRRLSMSALALATTVASGTWDARATGVDAATARGRTVTMLRRVTLAHVSTTPDGWGHGWQGPLWGGIAGRAAYLAWPWLPQDVRDATVRMVESEARWASTVPVTYYRDAAGVLLTPGDTRAEELAWDALPIQVARVLLPAHPQRPVWDNALARLSLAAWARPSDVTSTTEVAGAPLSAWLGGSNVEADGTVVNHDRVAPDYTTNLYQNLDGVLLDTLAGQPYPQALTRLLAPVWTALSTVTFAAPPFAAPGGTIYTAGSEIYYPQGIDWGTGQMLPYALVDTQAASFLGLDAAGTDLARRAASAHLEGQRALLARSQDGRTYVAPQEYVYAGREEHTAQLASQLWLTTLVAASGRAVAADQPAWID